MNSLVWVNVIFVSKKITIYCSLFSYFTESVKYNFIIYFSCGLSTATIEYSCPPVCLSAVCLSVSVSVYAIAKNNG